MGESGSLMISSWLSDSQSKKVSVCDVIVLAFESQSGACRFKSLHITVGVSGRSSSTNRCEATCEVGGL